MPVVPIRIPDIGDFEDVEVIEILVAPGDRVEVDDPLITLESEKATMEIPSPHAGTVRALSVAIGDAVSEGHEIAKLEVDEEVAAAGTERPSEPARREVAAPERATSPLEGRPAPRATVGGADSSVDVAVIGGGPGGYTAAFRAADLGRSVTLIERYPALGGVCLNVGCIPSKALLHLACRVREVSALAAQGIEFGPARLDLARIRAHKGHVVQSLGKGLHGLARRRKVNVVRGVARFESPHQLEIETAEGARTLEFQSAIVAAGSRNVALPGVPADDPRILDSTRALELREIPPRLLIIGAGIIGLELATVYHAFGSAVTVVEMLDRPLAGVDPDVVKPLEKALRLRYDALHLQTRVTAIDPREDGLHVELEGPDAPGASVFDSVLVAVGRRPNSEALGLERAGVRVDPRGFIPVDAQRRSAVGHIFAIGDIAGPPMLAHKAVHEGKTAAEALAGLPVAFDPRAIPSVAYTDPEVAWMGQSESEAREQGIEVETATFPWSASGRALSLGATSGLTKLVFARADRRLLGAALVGPNAGELIAETVLALEMGADAEDLARTVHAHPTLSETVGLAAEMVTGSITDLLAPRG
ncbi:MAG: dihydrolipoyl dehydrogenase [Myxococcota bacterium]